MASAIPKHDYTSIKRLDELARAYMGAGKSIFDEDDPKYLDFLKTRLKPPTDGW